ncbi:MAG: helix-turn-helix transcriptional regulator [Armatimonadota bacterium]|nr:helix-turn-helix transcriptional regulator [Armatimonadota bacterium]
MGKLSRLIEPVVLLAIRNNPDIHGYQLLQEIENLAMTDSEVEPGAVYRTLRQLEAAGMVTSRWDTTANGPARRCYRLTDEGLQHLDDWAALIEKRRSEMERFLKVYKGEE